MTSKLLRRVVLRLAAWRGDTRAVAAVEFGLVGGIFVLFLCFFFELGVTLLVQTSLDAAVRKESRLIKIGAIQASQQSTFLANICADMSGIINCKNLQVNVASNVSFGLLSATNSATSTGLLSVTGFNPGVSGSDVIVQVGYTRPLIFSSLTKYLGKNGNILLISTTAFQNEPF